MKRREKVLEIHLLKNEGYKAGQIVKMKGITHKTIARLLRTNPEHMCVDGTQIYEKRKRLEPYREQIYEFLERGFRPAQILKKLRDMYPSANIKRSTLGDFCREAQVKLFKYTQTVPESQPILPDDSILTPYSGKINEMLSSGKNISLIFAVIKSDGYSGSYSLLQQYCHKRKPSIYRTKKEVFSRTLNRKILTSAIWSGATDLTEGNIDYITANYPVFGEIKSIITEFRTAYSNKDIETIKSWCVKYSQCKFPAICSFINGVNLDTDAFYNSLKYDYSNGLLEGCVNKLKTIKRSMFGRAGYPLLRAKILLSNSN